MKRRNFLLMGTLLTSGLYFSVKYVQLNDKSLETVQPIIHAVQMHLFPQNSTLPSASSVWATTYLLNAISHHSYDRKRKRFIILGALLLQEQISQDITELSTIKMESVLRQYEKSNYGKQWLHSIMELTLEVLLGDPIYGQETIPHGWKALSVNGGVPRPQKRYIYESV